METVVTYPAVETRRMAFVIAYHYIVEVNSAGSNMYAVGSCITRSGEVDTQLNIVGIYIAFEVNVVESAEQAAVSAGPAGNRRCESGHERLQEVNRHAVGIEIDIKGLIKGKNGSVDTRAAPVLAIDVGIEGEGATAIVPGCLYVGIAYGAPLISDRIDVKIVAGKVGLVTKQIACSECAGEIGRASCRERV